jgi:hypothetical protein
VAGACFTDTARIRNAHSRPLVAELETWLRRQRAKLSAKNEVAKAIEAIADPSHERHRELKEWFADDFNPHVVDIDWLSEDVADLAQRWSRQPAVKRRRTA